MNNPSERSKLICEMYNKGLPVVSICKQLNVPHNTVILNLKRWYKEIYNEPYKNFHEKRCERLKELADKFKEVYKPFIYNRTDMCKMLNCNIAEFECMLKKYNLTHLRLQTYKYQRTLCNVPQLNYNEYKKYAKAKKMSMRELACVAINEYILNNL